MKFAKNLQESMVPEWRDAYVDYKGLKKVLKLFTEIKKEPGYNREEISLVVTEQSDHRSDDVVTPRGSVRPALEVPTSPGKGEAILAKVSNIRLRWSKRRERVSKIEDHGELRQVLTEIPEVPNRSAKFKEMEDLFFTLLNDDATRVCPHIPVSKTTTYMCCVSSFAGVRRRDCSLTRRRIVG